MGRVPCCDENTGELKRGPWAPEEDRKLMDYIQKKGHGSWRTLPKNAGLSRCGKSCRLRWTNYLRPDIKRGRFSFEEEETIIQLHSLLGNKWATIASRLPGRTDNEIKNYWNTHVRKRLIRMGIDPVTHAPQDDLFDHHHQHQHQHHQDLIDSVQLGNSSELLTNIIANNPISAADEHRQQCNITNLQQQYLQQQQHLQFLRESQLHPLLPPSCSFQDSIPQINCPTGSNSGDIINNSSAFNSGTTSLPIPSGQYSHVVDYHQHQASNNPISFKQNFNFDPCVFSTPSSSLSTTYLNSTISPYNINSSNEDEKDITCSNTGINFHIPEFLDMSEFM